MRMADEDHIQPALFLYGAEVWKRVLCVGLPDSGIQQDPFSGNPQIDAAAADLHGSAEKM